MDGPTAGVLSREAVFIECIVAPSFGEEALGTLRSARWGRNVRIIEVGGSGENQGKVFDVKPLSGGFLVQERDEPGLADPDFRSVSTRLPEEGEKEDLFFAWHVVKHVKSNGIVVAKDGMVLGVGAGQTSRVDAVEMALKKAGSRARGAVLASDGFFPFKDSIELAAKAGITAVMEPGGSRRDSEVIEAADAYGLALVFTGVRHFKH